ncbi:hypothetical protein [Methylobacterium sp. WL6]|uniref:hypothetical protein n=1 Tax=Methylobacterium sp. WL6 TaxID=2603901 RepID=UPI0011CA7D2B|nr:hypothetical protein [Methylobacterium sp. WL6]TXN72713.1 hypothetical protein FV230_04025 [Methylobacterium sp. WL6]
MSAPSDRRGFLRGLVSLPLIGGGVTLIGKPTQAAEATSIPCAENYAAWLHYEQRALQNTLYPGIGDGYFIPQTNSGATFHFDDRFGNEGWWQRVGAEAMARAPVVLATVGCDWREVRR